MQPGFSGEAPPTERGYPLTQPAFPYPGGFPRPDYSRKPRKKRLALWIGLVTLLLLAVGSSSYYYFVSRSTPQKTLEAYCSALKNNDAQSLYATFSAEQQTQTSVSKLQEGLRLLAILTGGFKNCTADNASVQEKGSTAAANITLVTARGPTTHMTIQLINENGAWRVAKNTNLP